MKGMINQLVQTITGKEDLDQCSETELQQLSAKYPYSAAISLLLVQKKADLGYSGLSENEIKTSIFFQDPLWFDHFLNDTGNVAPELLHKEQYGSLDHQTSEIRTDDFKSLNEEHITSNSDTSEIISDTQVAQELTPETITEPIPETNNNNFDELHHLNEDRVIEPEPDHVRVEEIDDSKYESSNQTAAEFNERDVAIEEKRELDDGNFETAENHQPVFANDIPKENFEEHDGLTDEDDFSEEGETDPTAINDKGPAIKFPEFKIDPIDPSKAPLSFEPYHTIDYFASLGIKSKEEIKPRDKFAVQLKSFTDWLKVMKKLPETELPSHLAASDDQVTKMAEVSIKDREVLTEAMAEVWLKQGNRQKATELYNKLSLLEPSKSAYFAAKIDQLK